MQSTSNTTWRTKTVVATALAGVAACGVLALQTAHASTSSGSAEQTARTAGVARGSAAPYVVNHYGEENADNGRAERTPKNLVLSEFTSISGLHWKEWGTKEAVATGKVTGNWCLETCLDKPLKATVTLSDPKTVNGKKVFSTFTLKLAQGTGEYESEDLQGKHALATS